MIMRSMLAEEDIAAIKAALDADKGVKGGRTRAGLATALDLAASAITDLLNKKRELKVSEVAPLQEYLRITLPVVATFFTEDALRDLAQDYIIRTTPKSAPVIGASAAGVWLEHDDIGQDANVEVPYVSVRYAHMEQFAYRIGGSSMEDELIFDGDYVICVHYSLVRSFPQAGDIVVAERRRGGLLERSCKKLSIDASGAFQLISCSSDPRFKDSIALAVDGQDVEVEIVGLVIGTYRPRF